jgi:glycosyltransferase involved in cell wall biosynthesis
MKVALLAPANVIHTQRWIEGLQARGVQLMLITQHDAGGWQAPPGVAVHRLPHSGLAGYFRNVPALRRLLRRERPDLLNAHYASGYGTLAALAGFRPWLLSVWGMDVYEFPLEGPLQRALLRHNLRRADAIASTSLAMAAQVRRVLPPVGRIAITPFGVDTARFAPGPLREPGEAVVIGTVKKLEPKYAIDVLLRAFALLAPPVRLLLVGEGAQRAELEALATELGVAERVQFVGAVPHADVPRWLHRMDIYVAVSRLDSESFGVAVIEASACELPVVVSDAGGLPEVVAHGETGEIVPREDAQALAAVLRRLVASPQQRQAYGRAGRARVQALYEWRHGIDTMLSAYRALLPGGGGPAALPGPEA